MTGVGIIMQTMGPCMTMANAANYDKALNIVVGCSKGFHKYIGW